MLLCPSFKKVKEEVQVAMLENCLGMEAMKNYTSFHYGTPERQRMTAEIIKTFEEVCIGDVNDTYEHFIFNNRMQGEGEEFEDFLTHVCTLIKTCNFCNECSESMIRDYYSDRHLQ